MPLTDTEIRDFQGLFLQQNSFTVPDGAMEEAMNVMIQSDGVISKTRGWYTYYTPPPFTGEDIRGLFEFQDNLLYVAFGGDMYWFADDDTDDQYSPVGVATQVTGGNTGGNSVFADRARSAKQNLNLYVTSDSGIYALEDYLGPLRRAGVPPGLDLMAEEGTSAVGPLPPDSQTAYRALFGRRDENGNLLLGTPSDIATVGVRADGTGYSYTSTGVGPYTVTVNVTDNSGFRDGQEIIVTNATDADADGTQTITIPTLSTSNIQFQTVANPGSGTLDITFTRTANLVAAIPSEIDSTTPGWFVRWYRTTSSAGLAVSPTPDFALIGEQVLTSAEIAARQVTFEDDVDPTLIGGQLYTNPNSREGEAQANARPPAAKDITLYNTYMFYANVETRQFISLQMVNFLLPGIPYEFKIRLGILADEVYYGYSTGVANQTVAATSVSGTGTITITYNSHGASNGWTVQIFNVTGGSLPVGTYTISGVTPNTFDITSLGNSATGLDFSFVTNGLGGVFYNSANLSSPGQMIALTCQYLVKSINRVSTYFYANYVSTFDDSPGKIRISTKQVNTIGQEMSISCDSDNGNWLPPLPTSFSSGVQVKADQHTFPDALYFSKADEPEAVPVVNFIRVGSRNKAIQRIFALRDCLVILKEDGVFVLTGQVISDFNVSTLDATVFFIGDRTADKINNTVIALSSNQGLVQITEKSVQIISRRMDDVIQPLLSFPTIIQRGLGFGHESGRLYYLSINNTNNTLQRDPQAYLYNVLNKTYTETDLTFDQMVIGPEDQLYASTVAEQNVIIRQRKSQTLIDFSNEFMTAEALASDTVTANVTLTGSSSAVFTPEPGDVIVYNDVINRIEAIEDDGVGGYIVTFPSATNIPTSGSPVDCIIYEGYESSFRMAPFHAGAVSRMKHYSSMQLHLRQNSISELNITWGGAYFGSSDEVDWSASLTGNSSSGWGFEPWGLFPWGLADSIRLQPGTSAGVIIRTWVTKFAARNTYIQANITHRQACEQMLIQAMSYAVLGYSNRTSR